MKKTLFLLLILLNAPFAPLSVFAQTSRPANVTVSGVVSNNEKVPMAGITVLLKGTNKGTTTNEKGQYSISVPAENSVLIFSFLGYQTVERNISAGQTRINVTMKEESQGLEEVVVIGYGEMRKRDITGAISSVSSESIGKTSPINVFDALQGQVAGLEITSGSGAPGEGSVIRIRGTATFEAGAQPLFVVDGVIYDNIDDLNPGDIQSIEVLKDAASAAIYGSRSANGVILITTKQGEVGKLKLDIRYSRSYSKLTRKMPTSNAAERKYYDIERRRISQDRLGANYGYTVTDSLCVFNNQDQDMQDLIFRTAKRDEVSLSASGATSKFNYYMSGAFLNEEGIIINSHYKRLTARSNAEYKPNSKLTVGTKVYFSYADRNGISESGVLNQLMLRVPYWAMFHPDGSYVPNISGRGNPYATAMTDINKGQTYRTSINDYLRYRINKYLTFNTNIQGVFALSRTQTYRPRPQLAPSARTTGVDNSALNYNWANENFLNYKQTFKRKHTLEAMIGASFQAWHTETIRVTGMDYTTDEIYTLNGASAFDAAKTYSRISENSMASFFGRVGYNFRGRYMINGTLRYDGSSRFGKDRQWGFFPSVSAAWRFSDEKFLSWMKPLVEDGKLRISYGKTGNESIPAYKALLLYSPQYIYEGTAGIGPSNLRYDGLGWEETGQFNVGLDLAMLKNKIRITADYYIKNTNDLLNNVDVPTETGFSSVYMNVGGMRNRGVEAAIGATLIHTRNTRWDVDFNITHNNTVITKLANHKQLQKGSDDAILIREGHRMGEFYGYHYKGIFAYDESNAFTEDGRQLTPNFDSSGTFSHYTLDGNTYTGAYKQLTNYVGDVLRGGDVYFADTNKDGMIDSHDRDIIGCSQPDFYGGIGTTVSYKGFSITAQIYYSIGGKIYNYADAYQNRFMNDAATPSPEAIHNMWLHPGDQALYPAPYQSDHNSLAPSDFYLEDASYIKLKNVRIAYQFPERWLRKIWLRSASIYIYGKNLLTFTDYKGYDPEFGDNSDPLVGGIDTNRYPRKREFGFGINFGF